MFVPPSLSTCIHTPSPIGGAHEAKLKILYISYPLLPLSDDIAGGAEQVLLTVAREMSMRGHEVTIAAGAGYGFLGKLIATGHPGSLTDGFERPNIEMDAAIRRGPAILE